jgi:MFS family permease
MSLTTEARSGSILGSLGAVQSGGAVVALAVVFLGFVSGAVNFNRSYVICAAMALIAAITIYWFPHMRDGEVQARATAREPLVLRREYKYYYLLSLLDGGRQQIFFSIGLWVLVHRYALSVPTISAVLLCLTTLSMFAGPWIGRMLDRHGERRMLAFVTVGSVVALFGYALVDNVVFAVFCYVVYSFIMPLSSMGAATYLRKVAVIDEIAPSLAMGITMQHVAAVVVPVATGFVLNFVGYQVPFLIGAGFACLTFTVTQRLSPETQKSPRRLAEEGVRVGAAVLG